MSRHQEYLEDVLDWLTAIERFACGDISGDLLDSLTGDLFDNWEDMNMLRSLG